ncbi:tyrosine phosphatase family-domain-containing protein [Dipodascopsis uninucleata]
MASEPTVAALIHEEYAVPENFAMVAPGIYRSSFPHSENFSFLKTKHFKSILVLVPETYPDENRKFVQDNSINFFQIGMSGNKEPFVNVSETAMTMALKLILNPENHPILIHCNRGKHRTGCLVGCLRKLQGWSMTMIFDEYRQFAHPKVRPLDQQFIELYDEREVLLLGRVYDWLPIGWTRSNKHIKAEYNTKFDGRRLKSYRHNVKESKSVQQDPVVLQHQVKSISN